MEQGSFKSVLSINSTAPISWSQPVICGRKLSPSPSLPWVSRASTYSRLKGLSSPLNTGISRRPMWPRTFFALAAPIAAGQLPQTMVTPATWISSMVRASISARLSSIPGSQSIITFLFIFPCPFLSQCSVSSPIPRRLPSNLCENSQKKCCLCILLQISRTAKAAPCQKQRVLFFCLVFYTGRFSNQCYSRERVYYKRLKTARKFL